MRPGPFDSPPSVKLALDDGELSLNAETLPTAAAYDELRVLIARQTRPPVADLGRLAELDPATRVDLLGFFAEERDRVRFLTGAGAQSGLFDAVLEPLEKSGDADRFPGAKRLALEAAAVLYGNDCEAACRLIREQCGRAGVRGMNAATLNREVRELVRELGRVRGAEAISLEGFFPEVELASKLRLPDGYVTNGEGLRRGDAAPEAVLPAIVLILARLFDPEGREWLELGWMRDGALKTKVVDRVRVANARLIVELAGEGFPVTSTTARFAVDYLAAFEAENAGALPISHVSSQLGWQGPPENGKFLLGAESVTADGSKAPTVVFRGADEGDDQIARAAGRAGSLEAWRDVIGEIAPYPTAMFAFWASFVPPLLVVLGVDNFVVDLAGRTTTGKTSLFRLLCSIWFDPKTGLRGWDITQVARERLFAVLSHLPVFLDDTKRAHSDKDMADTIYGVVQGVGRSRGTVLGLAAVRTNRTVLFTNGEEPITGYTTDGGTRARTLSLREAPFGESSPEAGALAARLSGLAKNNYGHAGHCFIRYVVRNRKHWGQWRELYRRVRTRYEARADRADNPFARRLAPSLAAIYTTGRLAHRAIGFDFPFADPVAPLWDELAGRAAGANRSLAAIRFLLDWAEAHPDEFKSPGRDRQPPSGWAGCRLKPAKFLPFGFTRQRAKELLEREGYEFESILHAWREQKLIDWKIDSDGVLRDAVKVRVPDGVSMRVIAFDRAAVEAALGD